MGARQGGDLSDAQVKPGPHHSAVWQSRIEHAAMLPGISFSDTKCLGPTGRFAFLDYQAASTIELMTSMYKPQSWSPSLSTQHFS